jgi:hypothetical protein
MTELQRGTNCNTFMVHFMEDSTLWGVGKKGEMNRTADIK